MESTTIRQAPKQEGTDAPETVTFIEMTGATAGAALEHWAEAASRAGLACELLASDSQEDIFLVICRGRIGPDGVLPDVPERARRWSFRSLRAYR